MPEEMQEPSRNGNRDDVVEISTLVTSESHSFQDADKLLHLAEDLQEKCEGNERRLTLAMVIFLGTMMTACGIAFPVAKYLDNGGSTSSWHIGAAFIFVSYVLVFLFYISDSFSKLGRIIRRDRRAYFEILDMLRELERYFNRNGSASRIERAEFLIRLSRLDIGPGAPLTRLILGVPVSVEHQSRYLKRFLKKK